MFTCKPVLIVLDHFHPMAPRLDARALPLDAQRSLDWPQLVEALLTFSAQPPRSRCAVRDVHKHRGPGAERLRNRGGGGGSPGHGPVGPAAREPPRRRQCCGRQPRGRHIRNRWAFLLATVFLAAAAEARPIVSNVRVMSYDSRRVIAKQASVCFNSDPIRLNVLLGLRHIH